MKQLNARWILAGLPRRSILAKAGVLAAMALLAGTAYAAPKQMKITFEGYSGGKPTLTNFPALVVFNNNVDGSGFNYDDFISSGGYDLRFVEELADSGSLNYEIESWAATIASPTNISGCALWLRGDAGVTTNASGTVTNWLDQSGNGRNASTVGGTPELAANGLGGSYAAVRFDYSQAEYFEIPGWTTPLINTIITVFRRTGNGSGGPVWQTRAGYEDNGFFSRFTDGNQYLNIGAGIWLGMNATTFLQDNNYIASATYHSTAPATRWFNNGTEIGSTNLAPSTSGTFTLGRRNASSVNYFQGDIAEVIVYDRVLSGAELAQVHNYLSQKYAITLTTTPQPSAVWVQVPEIPGDGTGYIYAKWGDTGDSAQLPCTTNGTTWDSGYSGVWHLKENSNPYGDSTINGNNSTGGRYPLPASARIDGGQTFQYKADNNNPMNITTPRADLTRYTLETWFKTTGGGGSTTWRTMLNKETTWPDRNYWFGLGEANGVPGLTEGALVLFHCPAGEDDYWANSTTAVDDDTWHHGVGTYDGSTMRVYVDGVLQGSKSGVGTPRTQNALNWIGSYNGGNILAFGGTLDEIRISTYARPSNHIWAAYQNMLDPVAFNAYDSMEDVMTGGAPSIQNQPVTDVTTGSATFNGKLTETGGVGVAVCVLWGDTNGGATWDWANTNWFPEPPGGWTNNSPLSTNISSGISANDVYWYTFAATNATTNKVAASSKYFITGPVTVAAPVNQAQYPDTDGKFTISRPEGCTNVQVTVAYTMSAGPPTLNTDYTLSGIATLAAGATNADITLSQNMGGASGTATMMLTVANANLYPVGTASNAAIELLEPQITDTVFVSPAGSGASHTAPYNSWAKAATNIATAIAWANANSGVVRVLVSNGTYNTTAELPITRGYSVRSFGNGVTGGLANARQTIVQRAGPENHRIFNISAASVELDGLTIRNGYGTGSNGNGGGGIFVAANRSPTFRNCIVKENTATGRGGGGFYWAGDNASLIVNCEITDNIHSGGEDDNGGGASYNENGYPTFRNCLIARNRATSGGCAGLFNRGGGGFTVENCTIVSNRTTSWGVGAVRKRDSGGVYMRNTIVRFNYDAAGENNVQHWGGTADYTYTCTASPGMGGTGNTQLDPQFVDMAASNYTLKVFSPCVDTGNSTPVTWATDLAGNPRITNAVGAAQTVDMGAYEYQPGALEAGFVANKTEILAGNEVVFTAIVGGTNKDSLVYWWTFDDGNAQSGSDKAVVTNTYANPGRYSPSLTVSNAASEGSSVTRTDYIDVFGPIVYVSASSATPAVPYASWATAASTIGDAINALYGDVVGDAGVPGTVVLVSNGTYNITSTIYLVEPMTIRSYGNGVTGGLANARLTHVNGQNSVQCVVIAANGALLDGLTLRNGRSSGNWTGGGGVLFYASAVVSNCIIRNNVNPGGSHSRGAGVAVYNSAASPTLVNCEITDNNSTADDGGSGVAVKMASGMTIRNCLIARNVTVGDGGGLDLRAGDSALVENCTVVSNVCASDRSGGGIYGQNNLTVRNSIVYWNLAGTTPNNTAGGGDYTYTCAPDRGGTGMITDDPRFANFAAGDYTLASDSPCIDTGSNQAWMDGATDLAGNTRKIFGGADGSRASPKVDMGAYEAPEPPPAGTIILLR